MLAAPATRAKIGANRHKSSCALAPPELADIENQYLREQKCQPKTVVNLGYFDIVQSMRAFLVLVLLLQALVAQAGVPGISCLHNSEHASAGKSASISTSPGVTVSEHSHATKHQTGSGDSPSHDRCCCTFMGHCSSSAVDTSFPTDALSPPAALLVSRAPVSATPGFEYPPYRPPSISV
jgi:hypothetical protein